MMFSVPANGGYKVTPILLKTMRQNCASLEFDTTTVQTIRQDCGVWWLKLLSGPQFTLIPPASGKN